MHLRRELQGHVHVPWKLLGSQGLQAENGGNPTRVYLLLFHVVQRAS
jgi:hypothetical protein